MDTIFRDTKKIFSEIALDGKKSRLGLVSKSFNKMIDADKVKRETGQIIKDITSLLAEK